MDESHIFFKPESTTIRKIFDGTNYYQVPDYQRPYSWEDEQIEQLFDDIYDAFKNEDYGYFLGPVILVKTKDGDFEIVDGQQRLTTLTILFCVLRDLYLKHLSDKKEEDRVLKRKILNAIKSMVEEKYRLRLVTQAQYQNQFEQEILSKVKFPQAAFTKAEKKKLKYKFMNAALISKKKLDEIGKTEKIKKFVEYLLEKVVMITISCSNKASAIRLFQVLNTRGLDLSPADLVKSSLYAMLNENRRKQFVSTWGQIETLAENIDESVSDLLAYYRNYLLASKPRRALFEELEATFRKKKGNKEKKANKVVYDFKKFVDSCVDVWNEESKTINSLWYLPNQVFWFSILAAARKVNFKNFQGLSKELRRLYYSYWIAGYTTAKIRDFSYEIMKDVKKKRELKGIRKKIDNKMKGDRVKERIRENLSDDVYGNSWLKPLLITVEYEQTDASKIAYIELDRKIHIDHILPQKWESISYWKNKWKKDQAKEWLNRIGNLTLLSGKKNIEASNNSFKKKKKIYKGTGLDGTTAFLITQRILRENEWTSKQVIQRQKWFLKQIKAKLNLKF